MQIACGPFFVHLLAGRERTYHLSQQSLCSFMRSDFTSDNVRNHAELLHTLRPNVPSRNYELPSS
jgi:hypothetical protein